MKLQHRCFIVNFKTFFRHFGQSLIKENYHNSRTSDGADMKLGPVPKLDKRNKTTSKKFDDDVNLEIAMSTAKLEQYGSRSPDRQSVKLTFLLKVTFYLIKTDNRTNKISNSSNTIALSKGTIFAKNDDFLQRKMLISAKLRGTSYLKVSFLKLHMCVYLPSKFQVPSIILTSFIQGVALIRSHIFRNIFLMI